MKSPLFTWDWTFHARLYYRCFHVHPFSKLSRGPVRRMYNGPKLHIATDYDFSRVELTHKSLNMGRNPTKSLGHIDTVC